MTRKVMLVVVAVAAVLILAGSAGERPDADASLRTMALLFRRLQLGFGTEHDHI